MKKFIPLLLGLVIVGAHAEVHLLPYGGGGVAKTVEFKIYNADGTLDVDEVDGGAEITLDCNGTPTNPITNDFVDEGAFYSIVLTAAELACGRLAVTVAATLTEVFFIETYGHPLAQHPWIGIPGADMGVAQAVDGDDSSIQLRSALALGTDAIDNTVICIVAGTSAPNCRTVTAYSGAAADEATVNAPFDADPDATSFYYVFNANQTVICVDAAGNVCSDVVELGGSAGAATKISNVFDDEVEALANLTVGTVTTYTGNTPQTGDSFARLGAPAGASVSADIAAIEAQTDDIGVAGAGLTAVSGGGAVVTTGTASSGSVMSLVSADLTETQVNHWRGAWIKMTGGTLAGQMRMIETFDPTSDSLTVVPDFTAVVDSGDTFDIIEGVDIVELVSIALAGQQ